MADIYGIKLLLEGMYASGSDLVLIGMLGLFSCVVVIRAVIADTTLCMNKATCALILASFLLFVFSLLRNPDGTALRSFGKYAFCVLLYFNVAIIKNKYIDSAPLYNRLWIYYHAMFYICIIYIMTGNGIKIWGSSVTLVGAYYYKTDYAGFLFQFLIVSMYKVNSEHLAVKIYVYVLIVICLLLILLTNTRMYIPLVIAFMTLFVCEIKGYEIRRILKSKSVFVVLAIVLTTVLILVWGPKLFPSLHMLGFDFEDDLLSRANTQGRSVIWENILNRFQGSSLTSRLFGIDLSSVYSASGLDAAAHSMYIYILYAFGYVGATVFLLLFIRVLFCAIKCPDRCLGYTLLLASIQYLVSGLTQDSIIFTNQTAFLFFTLSVCEGISVNQNSFDYVNK